jgi:RNA recognition motif-containing protein
MGVRLFIGNLPYNTTETDLREHFSAIGLLSYVYLPADRETGKPRGFAFVEFAERPDAEEAINRFNGQSFKGRAISVSEARAREDRPATAGSRPPMSRAPSAPEPLAPSAPPAGRNFGPDAAPRNKRKQQSQRGGGKSEHAPKRPIRERPGGRLFFGGEDDSDDQYDGELEGENFASRVDDSAYEATEE